MEQLRPCPRCGYQNKSGKVNCWKCGNSLKAPRSQKFFPGLALLVAVIALIWIGFKLSDQAQIPPSLEDQLRTALGDSKLDQFTDNNGAIYIHWTMRENLNASAARFTAKMNAAASLETIQKSGKPFETITMFGAYPLLDESGAVANTDVLKLVYKKKTVQKIIWDSFDQMNIIAIADQAIVHPNFLDQP